VPGADSCLENIWIAERKVPEEGCGSFGIRTSQYSSHSAQVSFNTIKLIRDWFRFQQESIFVMLNLLPFHIRPAPMQILYFKDERVQLHFSQNLHFISDVP
jgi:hypothetical protein